MRLTCFHDMRAANAGSVAHWLVAASFALGTTEGCRAVQCLPPDPSASVIAEQGLAAQPRVVTGHVLNFEMAPVVHAQVRLRESDSTCRTVDAAGAFLLHVARAGTYTLEVSARDYNAAVEAVALRPASGVEVLVVMVRTAVRSRRPAACGVDTVQPNPQ